jgi:hypothetical protein
MSTVEKQEEGPENYLLSDALSKGTVQEVPTNPK